MKFSAKEQCGLRAMVEFALHRGEGPTSLNDVALAQDMSLSYLEQIVAPLRRAGLLRSERGAHGGYELTRLPEYITVADVLRALDGALVPVACLAEGDCHRKGACATRSVWQTVRDKLAETLESITLEDLCQQKG
jgi:Rrf2 family protein